MADSDGQRPVGRPSLFTPELAAQICEMLAEGQSLRKICEAPEMPSRSSVLLWLRESPEFSSQYARAREACADLLAEDIIAIADEAKSKEDAPAIKVRVDARIWVASKLKPKVYGNHQAVAIGGADGGPIQVVIQGDDTAL
jgi:hypothetical protein